MVSTGLFAASTLEMVKEMGRHGVDPCSPA